MGMIKLNEYLWGKNKTADLSFSDNYVIVWPTNDTWKQFWKEYPDNRLKDYQEYDVWVFPKDEAREFETIADKLVTIRFLKIPKEYESLEELKKACKENKAKPVSWERTTIDEF